MKFNWRDHLSTAAGLVTAISTAWMTIDWDNFDLQKEWPKLGLSAIIAAGGYFSSFKKNKDTTPPTQP